MGIAKSFLAIIVLLAAVICPGFAELCFADDFQLTIGKSLEVLYGGEVLIADDMLTYGDGWDAGKMKTSKKDGAKVVNTFYEDGDVVQYRREVGLSKERVELTCQFRMFPYKNVSDKPGIYYIFRIPYDRLKNTTLKAMVGRSWGAEMKEIELGQTRSDGKIFTGAHYAAFEGEDIQLVIDFHPKGLTS
jgi:hypothetical protein